MSPLQYSKSSRATCHGPAPCKGSPIELGSLRYGQVSAGKFGETVEWRHWYAPSLSVLRFLLIGLLKLDFLDAPSIRGCVTPDILTKLAAIKLETVPGFNAL